MSQENKPLLTDEQIESALNMAVGATPSKEAFSDDGSFSYEKSGNPALIKTLYALSIARGKKKGRNFHGS